MADTIHQLGQYRATATGATVTIALVNYRTATPSVRLTDSTGTTREITMAAFQSRGAYQWIGEATHGE